MTDIFQTIQKLKALYPDDVLRIEQEALRVKEILKKKDFALNASCVELVDMCRSNILEARKKLASDRKLLGNEDAQRELWFIVESRQWVLDMITSDYDAELKSIEKELEAEL